MPATKIEANLNQTMSRIPLTYGLTHIAIAVKDLDRTRKFYQSVFDMEVMYDEVDFLQLTTPGANDILVFEKQRSVQSKDTGGIAHFGFRLRHADSIKAMHKRIREAGAEIISKGEFIPGSPYIYFRDPDGYEVEVWYEAEVA